jgi:hypothetical protein
MIARILPLGLATAAALLLAGCITTVEVKKVDKDSNTKGLRYSLPATFLLVQPQADGSATYTWVHMPDPERTYAIKQHAILSKFTLDVATSNGLLTSAQSAADNTAVTAKLLEAAQAAKVADITKKSGDATKDATAAGAATTAERTTGLALAQAKAEQAIVDGDATAKPEEKRAAAVKVSNAQLAYNQAFNALTALGLSPSANDLPVAGGSQQQWGPVLFRLLQNTDGTVDLVAVNLQTQFDTMGAPAAGGAAAAAKPKVELKDKDAKRTAKMKPLVLTVTSDLPLAEIQKATTTLVRDGNVSDAAYTVTRSADGKTFTFTFPAGLQQGAYSLSPAIIVTAGTAATADTSLEFKVDAN